MVAGAEHTREAGTWLQTVVHFKTNIKSKLSGRVPARSHQCHYNQALLLLLSCGMIVAAAAAAAAAAQSAAEASVPTGVISQRVCQLALPKLWPHHVAKVQLCRHSRRSVAWRLRTPWLPSHQDAGQSALLLQGSCAAPLSCSPFTPSHPCLPAKHPTFPPE